MQVSRYLMKKLWLLIFFVFIASAFSGCTVKFVADYDSVTFEEILKVAKDVDRFYGVLLEAKSDDRAYQKYSSQYVEIESDIRSLVTRNKARALNEESTQISEIILKLWCKYKKSHAEKNAYSDKKAELDRNRFTRLFESAASAEKAKILKPDDKDPSKESA